MCPNAFIAAQTKGCVGPFSNFANGFLDLIFTAMFGIVGMLTFQPTCPHFHPRSVCGPITISADIALQV